MLLNYKTILILFFSISLLFSCTQEYAPDNYYKTMQEKDSVLLQLATYVIRQPEEVSDSVWYSPASDSLKMYKLNAVSAKLYKFYKDKNEVHYYCVYQRDKRSLYEDYRAYGGTYKLSDKGEIIDLEERFITPQLKIEAVKEASDELFAVLVDKGNVNDYIGNVKLMQWPSETVVYNKKTHKWDITENHELYFVQQMRDSAKKSMEPGR